MSSTPGLLHSKTHTHPPQPRLAAATTVSQQTQTDQILAQQRLNRPVAPHLMIYKAQVTWYLSALNRITGCTVSGLFYVFGSAYLIAPYVGWHLESSVIAASVATWPFVVKFAAKLAIAWPFTFHCLNGVRHLVWDTASMISNKKVQQSGWTVVALSTVGALALCFM